MVSAGVMALVGVAAGGGVAVGSAAQPDAEQTATAHGTAAALIRYLRPRRPGADRRFFGRCRSASGSRSCSTRPDPSPARAPKRVPGPIPCHRRRGRPETSIAGRPAAGATHRPGRGRGRPARSPPTSTRPTKLAPVQRDGAHVDQRLTPTRRRVGNLAHGDAAGSCAVDNQGLHLSPSDVEWACSDRVILLPPQMLAQGGHEIGRSGLQLASWRAGRLGPMPAFCGGHDSQPSGA